MEGGGSWRVIAAIVLIHFFVEGAVSAACENHSPLCGKNPGWPTTEMCATNYVRDKCHQFCGICSCPSHPACQNGGRRGGNPENYGNRTCDCNCVGLWSGHTCSECQARCLNGGTLDRATCTCKCTPGWDGDQCQDPCVDKSPLCGANPGWPTQDSCKTSYVRDNCHAFCGVCETSAVTSGGCKKICRNGGTLYPESCVCECGPGWLGDQCSEPCENKSPLCGASPGWPTTDLCSNNYVITNCPLFCGKCECQESPRCRNGGYRGNNPSKYGDRSCECNCAGLWSGPTCAECRIHCEHGGVVDFTTCSCLCSPGWDGPLCTERCEDKHPYCGANPGWPTVESCNTDYVRENCHAFCGVCLVNKGKPTGSILKPKPTNIQGDGPGTVNFCITAPCRNGGTCIPMKTGFRCNCLQGFEGARCEIRTDCKFSFDLVFLVDGSTSVGPNEFDKSKAFLRNVINQFQIGPDATKVGVIQYSSTVREEFSMNRYLTKQDVMRAIDRIPFLGGFTRTGEAITFMKQHSQFRGNVPKIAIVITDGRAQDDVSYPSQMAHSAGVIMYAISVGSVNMNELKLIASAERYITTVSDFDALSTLTLSLTEQICRGAADTCQVPVLQFEDCLSEMLSKCYSLDGHSRVVRVESTGNANTCDIPIRQYEECAKEAIATCNRVRMRGRANRGKRSAMFASDDGDTSRGLPGLSAVAAVGAVVALTLVALGITHCLKKPTRTAK
ncbi:COL12A1 [Branchiostoma lanceolatum]|uniref:COL12A1 protein n=1 Tax=Branchiostoma lanceolatum TaxID=7740 RepID=A0A8J9ZF38_BRALA|nr:COL12A1 [Branchiostoma lanceolatum]